MSCLPDPGRIHAACSQKQKAFVLVEVGTVGSNVHGNELGALVHVAVCMVLLMLTSLLLQLEVNKPPERLEKFGQN